ncbi:UDP-N-acetylmuramoyl-L-alanyl-D-glutamate--2,6-diaminopimelate ligase [bacterium]|nr:UDP-N-acetylmuramoyl-L-alanyl-D-glutamate--2,6-diaminopimelate ligase [bacterium]MBU1674699.1 UDP-N-acetylmuramoyl-L-alanyl-D-glutamate--2,6-diaminopimelate ligase [bacterium]
MVSLGGISGLFPELRLDGDPDVEIELVSLDSRRCGPRSLFVAVQGHEADGHAYVAEAVAAGCAAVLVAAGFAAPVAVPTLRAEDTGPWPARLARVLLGEPDEALTVVGVTGTNGKTTTAFLVRDLLAKTVGGCGLLGTIRYETGARSTVAPLTTPYGPALYGMLAEMRDHGLAAVALEISSHALEQSRTADLSLDAAVLTNLGRDHLDYHPSPAAYLAAKGRILDLLRGPRRGKPPGVAVINAAAPAFAALDTSGLRCLRYAAGRGGMAAQAAELRVIAAELRPDGTDLRFDYRGRELSLSSRLAGRFNVDNLTAALAVGLALGLDAEPCLASLSAARQVPGRLEFFALPTGATAVVDYAHTPDALAAVLETCGEFTTGRMIVVFGCGGDRDRGKRAEMGAVAARLADDTWITSDNPRTEEPTSICDMIYFGFRAETDVRSGACRVEVDRTRAIRGALASAAAGDTVVIAGKGHEDYQLVGTERRDLDDRRIVRDWIEEAADG